MISKILEVALCACISMNFIPFHNQSENLMEVNVLEKKTTKEKKQKNITEEYFEIATNLTSDKVTYKNKSYYYGVYRIPNEYNNNLKDYGKFESNVLYYSMANYLNGYSINLNSGSAYSMQMVGVKTNTREEFQSYYDNLSQFILTKNMDQDALIVLMNKFQSNSYITGEFDYDSRIFSFAINDCTACASEMGVSEETLGFILAFLTAYGSEITFSKNQCNFQYKDFRINH